MEITLRLPQNYVEIEEEEMMYLDGGEYISRSSCRGIMCAIGISPSTYIASVLGYTLAVKLIKKATSYCGWMGKIASVVLGYATSQIIAFDSAIARGAIHKGVSVGWNWNIFNAPVGITTNVHY